MFSGFMLRDRDEMKDLHLSAGPTQDPQSKSRSRVMGFVDVQGIVVLDALCPNPATMRFLEIAPTSLCFCKEVPIAR